MFIDVNFYYFSPTGGTRKAGRILAEAMGGNVSEIDLGKRQPAELPGAAEAAVIAMPVFGGRLPTLAAEKLKALRGNGQKTVSVVVYGNRAYEDALAELNDIISGNGFQIYASGAFVAQHSIVTEVAAGRPDSEDAAEIREFAEKILRKMQEDTSDDFPVPGNRPYKPEFSMPVTPVSLPSCRLCGKCAAVCPAAAIRLENESVVTDGDSCILCMACVAACPEQARVLPPPVQEQMNQKLGALKNVRSKNEFFL